MALEDFDFSSGIRRRRNAVEPDPFSAAARFPTLVERDKQALQTAGADIRGAELGGPNSIAGRFNPLSGGSIFSRQSPGAFDTLRDQQRQADPSNNFYNGGGMERRGGAAASQTLTPAAPVDDARTRYAADTGYKPDGSFAQQTFNSATNTFNDAVDIDPLTGMPRKRNPLEPV